MLQQDEPDDFVICTEQTHMILDFVKISFEYVNLDYTKYVEIDSSLYRPAEVDYLKGSNNKAKKNLKWIPTISFEELVHDMVDSDLKAYSYA
jgi:GDPmannose 4,6-dehydratase